MANLDGLRQAMTEQGWFQDPENPANERYWNGDIWTTYVRARVAPQMSPPPYLPPAQHSVLGSNQQVHVPQYEIPLKSNRPVRTRLGFKIVGVCAAVVIGLVVYGATSTSTADMTNRDANGNITDSGQVGVFKMRVGDCIDDPTASIAAGDRVDVEGMQGVPCSSLHNGEVFGTYESTLAAFSLPALESEAQERCEGLGLGYVAEISPTSDANLAYLVPNQTTWGAGDREVICYFHFPTQRSVSVKNGVL